MGMSQSPAPGWVVPDSERPYSCTPDAHSGSLLTNPPSLLSHKLGYLGLAPLKSTITDSRFGLLTTDHSDRTRRDTHSHKPPLICGPMQVTNFALISLFGEDPPRRPCTPRFWGSELGPPSLHLYVVPVHVSGGISEEAVGDEAVGVDAVNERKCRLRGRECVMGGPGSRLTRSPCPGTCSPGLAQPHHARLGREDDDLVQGGELLEQGLNARSLLEPPASGQLDGRDRRETQ